MNDYGKAQAHLAATKRAWNYPGKTAKKPAKVPEKWTGDEWEWTDCMLELGYENVDDSRWCETKSPKPGTFGWCVIVGLTEQGDFDLALTIDTLDNEQDSPWVYPAARFATPLEAARAGLAIMAGLSTQK